MSLFNFLTKMIRLPDLVGWVHLVYAFQSQDPWFYGNIGP